VLDRQSRDADVVDSLGLRLVRRAQTNDVYHVAGLYGGARLSLGARFADRIVRVDDHADV
jgi:hypothetical protein